MYKVSVNRQRFSLGLLTAGLLSLLFVSHSGYADQVPALKDIVRASAHEQIDWDRVLNSASTREVLDDVARGNSPGSDSPPDFSGTWVLDRSASDDPQDLKQSARKERSRSSGGFDMGGGRRGGPGAGRGRGGPPGGMAGKREDRQDMTRDLMQHRLVIVHREPELSIIGPRGQKQTIYTDFRGRSVSALQGLSGTSSPLLAGWEGDVLVIERDDLSGSRIQRLKLLEDPVRLQRTTVLPSRDASGKKMRFRQVYLPQESGV